ncbi:MAG TPA: hypothetical protein VF658_16465 [Pyrinomonadaceae bacterium]|jgi:hypothetical protein
MMTPEQRLDRLERIARLMVSSGLRERRRIREMDDKIGILVDMQVKNEERFALLAEAQRELAESQAHTGQRLDALIDIIREGRNGKPPTES